MRRFLLICCAIALGINLLIPSPTPATISLPFPGPGIQGASGPFDCTGGTITYFGGKTIHTFTSSGTLNCTNSQTNGSALAVGGGGGGGGQTGATGVGLGGGGGGGVVTCTPTINTGSYSITVGTGGAGSTGSSVQAGSGGNTSVSGLTGCTTAAVGGGGGGSAAVPQGATNGGSGGGSTFGRTAGTGTGGQGNSGGVGDTTGATRGGGGGGCGGSGAAGSGTGNGGAGCSNSISGSAVTYGAGGGGGAISASAGSGGNACAGNGGVNANGSNASGANQGCGGGGAGSTGTTGGNGSGGVFVIAYNSSAGLSMTSVGSNMMSASARSSCTMTTTAAIPAGSLSIIAVYAPFSAAQTISSVSDGTNSYTSAVTNAYDASTQIVVAIYYKENATAVSSGATITVNFSGSTNAQPCAVNAGYITNALASSSLDKTNSGITSNGTAYASGSTGTLTTSNQIAVCYLAEYNASATITDPSGFTTLNSTSQGSGAFFNTRLYYQIVSATTALNCQPSTSVNTFGKTLIATFKGP